MPKLRLWLEAHNWPFEFFTEATLNLADDDELLGLMEQVGFSGVFIGIETPDDETLVITQKNKIPVARFRQTFAKSTNTA